MAEESQTVHTFPTQTGKMLVFSRIESDIPVFYIMKMYAKKKIATTTDIFLLDIIETGTEW